MNRLVGQGVKVLSDLREFRQRAAGIRCAIVWGVVVDVGAVSSAVALIAATGAVSGVSESAALGIVGRVRERIRLVFGGDRRSADALDRAIEEPMEERVRELAAALAWWAGQDPEFGEELAEWGRQWAPGVSVTQNVRAGRDAFTAGRDMTVQQRADDRPGEQE